jgi:hypothetical protein
MQEEKRAYGECPVAEKLGTVWNSSATIINFREIASFIMF